MVKLSSGQYVIGFDNGYQFGKTAQSLFDNGVYAMGTVEPTVKEHSLKYGRKYYKVGEGRAAITEDKVSDENARLLTMVAIAKELRTEEIHKAEVILAVGLPFSDYGREKKALLEYYEQKPALKYEYEGIRYDVTISRIFVFPQCYSAIAPRLANMKGDYLVVDIGSKTTDVLLLKNGMPVERRSITVEKAMVKWMKQILKEYFENKDREDSRNEWLEQFGEEITRVVEQAVRNCISGGNLNATGTGTALIADAEAAGLPEQSEEIPEGALDFLDGME